MRTWCLVEFAVPADHREEDQRKRKERQVLRPCLRPKKAVEQEGNGDTNCDWFSWNGPKKKSWKSEG